MSENKSAANEGDTEDQLPPITLKPAVAEGQKRPERPIAFYWTKLAFLLFVVPILGALVFPRLPFVHVFDEPGSGTALGIIIGFYVLNAGVAWLVGTAIGMVVDIRAWRRLRKSKASLVDNGRNWPHAFNVIFWLTFLPISGFIAWVFLAGFFI